MEIPKCKLILEDGTTVIGKSFGAPVSTSGELVFNTAMNGYPENLTDPSYHGQILVVTFPLVGNYGIPNSNLKNGVEAFFESSKIHIAGLIICYHSEEYSHWNAIKSLGKWLQENHIPALYDVDTRMITKLLRSKGTMMAKIECHEQIEFQDINQKHLVAAVSTPKLIHYEPTGNPKSKTVVLVDCGVKNNIIRCFQERGIQLICVPWDYDFSTLNYDGLFISNGPGNPEKCQKTITNIQKALQMSKPIFGICLGNQLLGMAAGARIYKLKYGHRSYNQPVMHIPTKQCYITSQNHGYALDNSSLNEDWEVLFTNLNDNTCEGIKHKTKPFFAVQFHPEAAGGPMDTSFLFDEFINQL